MPKSDPGDCTVAASLRGVFDLAGFDGQPRSGAVDVLTRAAQGVHSLGTRGEKLDWVVSTACEATGAHVAAFVGVRPLESAPVAAIGAPTIDVDRLLRPAMARLLARVGSEPEDGGGPFERTTRLPASELMNQRAVRMFLQRLGLPLPCGILCVPVPAADGSAHGVVLCVHPDPSHFTDADGAVLRAVGVHVGVALDNLVTMIRLAELEALQREAVHQLQEAVRPPMPSLDTAELGVHYLPADASAPTGGDLYDWMVMPGGDLHLAVIDVMGKGVAATKDAVGVMHALRMLALDGCPLHRMVARADALVTAHNPELVATVLLARYRPEDGVVHLAGGGQPPPLVVSSSADVRTVPVPGVAIGWPSAGTSEVVTLTLDRNETLIMYTDGLIEATKDVLAGLEMLCTAAAQTARYPAGHLARSLVERSLAGAMRRDDALALVLRRRVPPPVDVTPRIGPFSYRFSPNPATVPIGRHLLTDWFEHLGMDVGDRDDLVLAASELCSNAIRHSSGAPGALELRAWTEADSVLVEVADDGGGFGIEELSDEEDQPDLVAEQGRGLYVVRALVDLFEVRREEARTIVRVARRAVLPG